MYKPIEKSPEQAPTYQLHMNYNHQLLLTVCAIFCMKTIHLNIILLASHVLNIFCPYQNILECVINSIRIDRMGSICLVASLKSINGHVDPQFCPSTLAFILGVSHAPNFFPYGTVMAPFLGLIDFRALCRFICGPM